MSAVQTSFRYGTAILDFGNAPGKTDTTVVVTGQNGIGAQSLVRANLAVVATATHSVDEVMVIGSEMLSVFAFNTVPNVGFSIRGLSRRGSLRGTFIILWSWA